MKSITRMSWQLIAKSLRVILGPGNVAIVRKIRRLVRAVGFA